jgi:DNA-directed RNA polymerase subunit beta'
MTTESKSLVSGNAFKAMLAVVDPARQMKELINEVKITKSISKKDDLIKRIKYLNGLSKTGLKADEAYVVHNVAVVPPVVRPVTVMGGNRLEFSDVNNLYSDHMVVNNALKEPIGYLPPGELIEERSAAYNGLKAIVGLGEAISPNSRGRGVKGLLKQVAGVSGPKGGLFHSKILSKKQDFSGRATIYAEPNLGFNEAAIPSDILWTMYKLHILRDLSKNGYDYINAAKAYEEKSPAAVVSFNKMIKAVPMIINRAPTLMKSNVSAIYPVPIKGTAVGINPLHLPYFAADIDGDAFSLFVPMNPEAVEEAKQKLLPQHHIFDARKGVGQSMVSPSHEAILGSMAMTEPDHTQKTVIFKTEALCLAALERGEISENTPVEITG